MISEMIFNQQNGDVTKAYYAKLNGMGLAGQLAVALFRAQKRSTAAKKYRGRRFTRDAYEVKNWSLSEICRIAGCMSAFESSPVWGWKRDPATPGYEWVLYVELPTGQCSFHSPDRLNGPDFTGDWDSRIPSQTAITRYCDSVWEPAVLGMDSLAEIKAGRFAFLFDDLGTCALAAKGAK